MLPVEIAKVDESLLTTVCSEHWPESQTLDFKRLLPANDEKGKQEFLKDVCAFANAGGGDLVYGIQEKPAGHADQVIPIQIAVHSVDATKRHLAQLLDSGIEPRLPGVVMQPVPLTSGDYLLVVRVPASFLRPHRYRHKDHTRWVVRADTRIVDFTYEQIRDAFDRGAALAERARRFRDERLSGVISGTTGRPLLAGPCCVVHLIPLASVAGRATIDPGPLYHEGYQQFMFGDWGGATRAFNLDGLVVYPGRGGEEVAYTQVFRAGAFEAARWVGMITAEDPPDKTAIASATVSDFVRDALIKFFAAAARWKISGPAIVAAALLDVSGWHLRHFPRSGWIRRERADRPNLFLPEVWVDQVGAIDSPDVTLIQPLLDTLWQAFGFERCAFYDAQGNWTMH